MSTDPTSDENPTPGMELGAFSVSLTVADLAASRQFYEKLGFRVVGGDASQNWLILRAGGRSQAVIGLFQGMFEKNILTFNPGWAQDTTAFDSFTDIRELQSQLEAQGITPVQRAADGTGPASFVVVDPDGNPILVDQHVACEE